MEENSVLLRVSGLKKHFPIRKGVFKRVVGHVKAVDGVSFHIRSGETLGLVGESGCGKTTVGRCIVRLYAPTNGKIEFRHENDFVEISRLSKTRMRAFRRDIQMVFQDPFSSLNPRMHVQDIIAEPLRVHGIGTAKTRTDMALQLLEKVGMDPDHMRRYPHEFSGGQRQRIGIARALMLNPRLVVCDEPVSALDVSIQAQVLNLLSDLQSEFQLTYLFIAHDLGVVEHISDRVIVMYLGKVMEVAAADSLYKTPKHPYTEALLAAMPVADPKLSQRKRIILKGSVPDPSDPPPGCTFHTRCAYAQDICRRDEPALIELGGDSRDSEHGIACHFAETLHLKGYED